METKTTSKREYRFEIKPVEGQVVIVDKTDQELRKFDVAKLPQAVRDILTVHGLKQKLTDDTMVSKIGEDGDRLIALDGLWAQLLTGEWEKERVGVARPAEALIRLVSELKKIPRTVAEASLKSAGKDKWDGIRKAHSDRYTALEAAIKAEKDRAASVDLSDLS